MRIIVLGSSGMLGNSVGNWMSKVFGEDNVYLSYRNEDVSYGKNKFYFDPLKSSFSDIPFSSSGDDFLINAIGKIKPQIGKNYIDAIEINSIFPRKLANFVEDHQLGKMFQISTDCVYDGKTGNYNENSEHNALDFYGKTKSLGEPENCMVIRTSIIGEEIHNNSSLVSWIKSQKGKTINGFTNHFWNGITTNQYAKVCEKIIKENLYENGLFHVFSNIVSKYELVSLINERFNLGITIKPVEAPEKIDRTLSTIKCLNEKLGIPSIQQQIKDM
jgi:dTDP-4-dehydrorhamnose reductase